jgi:predicted NBD/HSP70 family sugar kinase
MLLDDRQRRIFHRLWAGSPLNRLELARLLGLTPNAAGRLVGEMIEAGLLRQCSPSIKGRGRPRIPIEIDTVHQHVLGIALYSGGVGLASLNLRGQPVGNLQAETLGEPARLIRTAAHALQKSLAHRPVAIGLSVPGFVDPQRQRLLLSAALPGLTDADLSPILKAAGQIPAYLQNDMHALAARWLLTQSRQLGEDVLLVLLADGQVGATILVEGKPNTGCILGANELGHMRLPVATDRCYCGQTGCIERIFSSEYARARLGLVGSLEQMIGHYDGRRSPLAELTQLTASALANVCNFVRPHRLVLVSPYTRHAVFANALLGRTRELLLPALAERVRIDLWEQPASSRAETAGYLPLAAMCLSGWES